MYIHIFNITKCYDVTVQQHSSLPLDPSKIFRMSCCKSLIKNLIVFPLLISYAMKTVVNFM